MISAFLSAVGTCHGDIHFGRAMGFGGVTNADLQEMTAMAVVMNLGAENNFHGSDWRSFLQ